jgi:hypothetical protein
MPLETSNGANQYTTPYSTLHPTDQARVTKRTLAERSACTTVLYVDIKFPFAYAPPRHNRHKKQQFTSWSLQRTSPLRVQNPGSIPWYSFSRRGCARRATPRFDGSCQLAFSFWLLAAQTWGRGSSLLALTSYNCRRSSL